MVVVLRITPFFVGQGLWRVLPTQNTLEPLSHEDELPAPQPS